MATMRSLLRRRAEMPFVDTLKPEDEITRTTVSEFERWRAGGCKVPPDLDEDRASYFSLIRTAATTTSMYDMGHIVAHSDPWVRLALVVNPSIPDVILCGDAVKHFGLAQDPNSWVRSTAWYRMEGRWPAHALAALCT